MQQVRKDPGATIQITVPDEVVAQLRAALPEPPPGAAVRKLLELMAKLPRARGRRTEVSVRAKEYPLLDHVPCLGFHEDFRSLGLTLVT